jgi:uncharacterized cupin superfamily protein
VRPDFIKNLEGIPEEEHYLDAPASAFRVRKRLGKATGSINLGINQSRLAPGQISSRFHSHSREEEFVLILSGHATLRLGTASWPVGPGDAISLRPGGPAHQLRNDSSEDCVYLEVSTRAADDVITYPEGPA